MLHKLNINNGSNISAAGARSRILQDPERRTPGQSPEPK